jgi:5-methylcytosine-specific restriction endonuclease McrA
MWEWLKYTRAANACRGFIRYLGCSHRERWPKDVIHFVRFSTNNQCFYCRRVLDQHDRSTHLHIDHYWPYSKGGSNELGNLVPACARCNLAKSALHPKKFMAKHDYVNAFCRYRYTDSGRYCACVPSRPNKYCSAHSIVRC